jgi:hypothetical protein
MRAENVGGNLTLLTQADPKQMRRFLPQVAGKAADGVKGIV